MSVKSFGLGLLTVVSLCLGLTVLGSGRAHAEDAQHARELFQEGNTYFDVGQFDKAIDASTCPGGSPCADARATAAGWSIARHDRRADRGAAGTAERIAGPAAEDAAGRGHGRERMGEEPERQRGGFVRSGAIGRLHLL